MVDKFLGGNQTNYTGEVRTPTAEMLLIKIMLNSVVSTDGAKFMIIDISNFYLNTPLKRFEYVKLKLSDTLDEIKVKYKLHDKAINGHVYVEVHKTIYGLPQSGFLSNELLFNNCRSTSTTKSNSYQVCENTKHDQFNLLSL